MTRREMFERMRVEGGFSFVVRNGADEVGRIEWIGGQWCASMTDRPGEVEKFGKLTAAYDWLAARCEVCS